MLVLSAIGFSGKYTKPFEHPKIYATYDVDLRFLKTTKGSKSTRKIRSECRGAPGVRVRKQASDGKMKVS